MVEWTTLHEAELLENWRRLHSDESPVKIAPLQDPSFFARVSVDADAGTIVWPNGVDLDPDMLYAAAHGASVRLSA